MNSSPASSSSAMPRRDFIKTSAGLAATEALGAAITRPLSAASQKRVMGANSRIRIGQIGCGDRGRTAHMPGIYKHVKETNFEIVALADPWRQSREKANAQVKDWFGREAKAFTSYRELLAMDDIDAVMI